MPERIKNPIIYLKNVRLSYPKLWKPKESDQPGGKPKYEATFILDKTINAKEIAETKAAIAKVKLHPKLNGKKPGKVCLREGTDTETRAEAEGLGPQKMTIGARNHIKPGVVDAQLNELTEDGGRPYAGCFVNARVEIYPYVHPKSGPGIAASLLNVQFLRDGAPFGERPVEATEGFSAVEETEDAIG